jgi:hypothetical protein
MVDATEAIETSIENREMEDASIPYDNTGNPVVKTDFSKNSPMWKHVRDLVLTKLYMDGDFFKQVIRDFAANEWGTSDNAKKAFTSFAAGLAVYGKLNTKKPEGFRTLRDGSKVERQSQFELAMTILREHPSILVERYAEDVGIVLDDEGEPLPY